MIQSPSVWCVRGVERRRLADLQPMVAAGKRLDLQLAGTARARRTEDGDALLHRRHEILLAEDREQWTREPFERGAGIVVEPAADELELGVVSRPVTVLARGRLNGLEVGSARAPARSRASCVASAPATASAGAPAAVMCASVAKRSWRAIVTPGPEFVITNATDGSAAATSSTTQPPWLWPKSPSRAGSTPGASRRQASCAATSAACSAGPVSRQSPVDSPTPRLSNDAAAMPRSSRPARIAGK